MTTHAPDTHALHIGILGCANIARQFARDVAPSPAVHLAAVASRDAAKARDFASTFDIARSHGRYEALLADDEVQAIYLPLPNSLHAEWAIRAAQAGKHVLCEKPLSVGLGQAQAMFAAERTHGVMLLEAYPYWFQPQTGAMVKLLDEGAIGSVRTVQASFGFTLGILQTNIRMVPELGGGALLAAGSYPMSLIRLAMGSAPQRVLAQSRWDASGVDIATVATLLWDDGRNAQLSCSMDTATHRRAMIIGSAGAIETEYLNHTSQGPTGHPHGYQPSQLRLRRGTGNPIAYESIVTGVGSGFRFAAEAFAKVVAERDFAAIERAAQASLDIAATLEAIAVSARGGCEVEVAQPTVPRAC